jgi:F-type H+-transporting ATPase subunit alpha
MLRLSLAQYRELAAFAQLSTELDKATKEQLTRGERMTEILKQDILEPVLLARQIMIIFAGNEGFLDDLPLGKVKAFEKQLFAFLDKKYAALEHEIAAQKALTDELKAKLKAAIQQFKAEFKKE